MLKKIMLTILLCINAAMGYCAIVDKVVAIVNDEVITQKDVDQYLAALEIKYKQEYGLEELRDKLKKAKQDVLNMLIEDRLILAKAKEIGLKIDEKKIDKKMEMLEARFRNKEQFKESLKSGDLNEFILREKIKEQMTIKKMINRQLFLKASVSPNEIRQYYEEHIEQFKTDKKVRVRNILLRFIDGKTNNQLDWKIEMLQALLKNGEDFAEIAKEYSNGPNAENGGDMGYVKKGQLMKELDQVLWDLKEGEISKPIKTKLGYHIIKREDMILPVAKDLSEVENEISNRIYSIKAKRVLKEWKKELRDDAYIVIKNRD